MGSWHHEYRWQREWLEVDDDGRARTVVDPEVRVELDQALADHAEDCAGAWVEPHMHRPTVSKLTRVIVTRRPPRHPRRPATYTTKLDPDPLADGADLDPPEAVQPHLELHAERSGR